MQPGALTVFLIFFGSLFQSAAQEFVGRWMVDECTFNIEQSDENVDKYRLDVLKDEEFEKVKGKSIFEFQSNGVVTAFWAENGDTAQIAEYLWRKTNEDHHAVITKSDNQLIYSCEIKNGILFGVFRDDTNGQTVTLVFKNVGGMSRNQFLSHNISSYFKAGVAPLEKVWTMEDYRDASIVLFDLEKRKVAPLPRYKDNFSSIFQKLVDIEAISHLLSSDKLNDKDGYFFTSWMYG